MEPMFAKHTTGFENPPRACLHRFANEVHGLQERLEGLQHATSFLRFCLLGKTILELLELPLRCLHASDKVSTLDRIKFDHKPFVRSISGRLPSNACGHKIIELATAETTFVKPLLPILF